MENCGIHHADLVDLLLAADSAQKLLAIAVARQADAGGARLPLDARSALPALEVQVLDTNLLLERLGLLVDVVGLLLSLALIVAAGVLGVSAAENLHDDTDDHKEPANGDDLKGEEGNEERPPDHAWEADSAVELVEGLEHPCHGSLGCREGASHIRRLARETGLGLGNGLGEVGVDRPADHDVEDVAGDEPGDDEGAEHEVAEGVESDVLQALGKLRIVSTLV